MGITIDLFKKLKIFSEPELQGEILKHGKLINAGKGDVIIKEGQHLNFLPIVIKGQIRVYQQKEDREILLYYVGPEQTCIGLGIGLSTGPVAAALLGSEERLEYTLIGDTVNLAQRLQDIARPEGRIVMSDATRVALSSAPVCDDLGEQAVKGRQQAVRAYMINVTGGST